MKVSLLAFVLLVAVSCGQKNRIPPEVIPQERMYKIMWDLMRADVFITDFLSRDSTKKLAAARDTLYEQVFRIHTTNRETFYKSLSFYQGRPDLLKIITDSLRSEERKAMAIQSNTENSTSDTLIRNPKKLKSKPDSISGE